MDAETVVKQYSNMVYSIALNYARNRDDADDIYSDVFLTYLKKERDFESEDHLKAWLIRVTINCAKDYLKKRQTDYLQLDECFNLQARERTEDVVDKMDVAEVLKKLTPAQREAIYLYYLKDLSIAKIAEILERPENTVKSDLHRGREQMKQYLEPSI